MVIRTEKDIIQVVERDKWMMDILLAAKSLDLPDWWVCAGFVRSKIWDTLHGFSERTPMPDVDVIYFDKAALDESREKMLEERLKGILPGIPWSVKNEARMHLVNHLPPYLSSEDALSKFPETATALGLKLDDENRVILCAPCGLADVLNLEVRPTAHFLQNPELAPIYENRMKQKNWKGIWPRITVYPIKE
ncbi:nucleotidyltransferase family protein [Neobacillus sp. YIM B06451]|uniref:nucleotidyltransferase family protein n=1 Tax=Neobacillus sp. YIM B06451 TaxID=3070994 RepID=UPI00292CD178|nr:nucleotidyltransferase family protein [Neobacillus sp. YIM B06451]